MTFLGDKIKTWNSFKQELNNWGKLEWIVEEPSLKTTFLDLNLQLNGPTNKTSTFQKSMNLYLYIPPLSSHPPSCLKGLISGELCRDLTQNNKEDSEKMLVKFIARLTDRGHKLEHLTPLFLQAAAALNKTDIQQSSQEDSSTLYINWTYHPKGLQRTDLRKAFEKSFKDSLPYTKMQIAMARPKNLRDILTRAATTLPEHLDIDQIISQISNHSQT